MGRYLRFDRRVGLGHDEDEIQPPSDLTDISII